MNTASHISDEDNALLDDFLEETKELDRRPDGSDTNARQQLLEVLENAQNLVAQLVVQAPLVPKDPK